MKSFLVIGMGRFGHHLAANLLEHGNEVLIIDSDEKKMEDLVPFATSAKIGDCTNPEVLRSLGVANFDAAFVCIGTNFQSSLEITSQLKEMGAKRVVSKATRDIQAKFLLRNGADEVIYPERDLAENLAARYSVNNVFDYIELDQGYAIYEIPPLPEWVDRSIRESDIAAKYHISILGIRRSEGPSNIMPSADYVIQAGEHLMVLAENKNLENMMKRIK
ncbi:MAG: TrkA family potassium uptake protein [Clostridiales bacterium]|nr:TrkA family potassium uptake protein [Clostridiales bacterium]